MATDTSAAVRFLKLLYPEGPWLLTAISPDKTGGLPTRTFYPGQEEELHAFIAEHNGRRNLYYSVNPPLRPLRKNRSSLIRQRVR